MASDWWKPISILSLSLNAHKDSANKVYVLILTETFCNSKRPDSFYQVHGYDLFRKDSVRKQGGGIMIYVNEKRHAKSRPDLMTAEIEVLWLEVYPFNSKRSLLIAGVYRPPSSTSDAGASIPKNIEKAYLLNKEMVLLGDFNVDFLNTNQTSKHKLIKILTNLHLTQLVKEVTRPISGTCLDHIWSSHPERLVCVQTKNIGMSDHLPTMAVRGYKGETSQRQNLRNTFSYRNTKRLDAKKFVDDLSKAPWDTAFVFEDTEDIVDSWYKIFSDILDSHIPVKEKRVKNCAQPVWFDSEINETLKKRDKLLKQATISESPADWATFKRAKN